MQEKNCETCGKIGIPASRYVTLLFTPALVSGNGSCGDGSTHALPSPSQIRLDDQQVNKNGIRNNQSAFLNLMPHSHTSLEDLDSGAAPERYVVAAVGECHSSLV